MYMQPRALDGFMNGLAGCGLMGMGDVNGDWGGETDNPANPATIWGGGSSSTGINMGSQPSYWEKITGDILKSSASTWGQIALISAIPTNTAVTPGGIFRNTGIIPGSMNLGTGLGGSSLLLIGGGLLLVMLMKR
jgi:hypothetical protein